jgi:hypothetical protein
MSDPELALEIWAYEHRGLLRALELVIDQVLSTTDEPALIPLHKALTNHLAEVTKIADDCASLSYKERMRARAKMGLATEERGEERNQDEENTAPLVQ